MRYYITSVVAVVAMVALSSGTVKACSVVPDYRVPTNLELVEGAPLILRARVVGETEAEDFMERALVVEPVEALLGNIPSGPIEIGRGSLISERDNARGYGVLSNPFDLANAHPLSFIGACVRTMFPLGTTALFFLEQRGGQWMPAGGPFSRWAEDTLDGEDPWVKLVRFYVTVAAAPAEERAAMLQVERDRLVTDRSDPVAQLMAADIERQLSGPNPTWHDQMSGYLEEGDVIPPGAEAEAAADAIAELVMGATDDPVCYDTSEAEVTCEVDLDIQAEAMEEASEDVGEDANAD